MTIKQLIDKDRAIKAVKNVGRKYYYYTPKPVDDMVFSSSKDKHKTNIYINYFKLLVDQKIDYLLAKTPTLGSQNLFSTVAIVDMLEDMLLNASLDSRSWLHPFLEDSVLKWMIVPDSEVIPIYNRYKTKLERIIRYYPLDLHGNPAPEETMYVQVWDYDGVSIYNIKGNQETLKGSCLLRVLMK